MEHHGRARRRGQALFSRRMAGPVLCVSPRDIELMFYASSIGSSISPEQTRAVCSTSSETEMKEFTRAALIALVLTLAIGPSHLAPRAQAQEGEKEKLDYAMIAKIREEGL